MLKCEYTQKVLSIDNLNVIHVLNTMGLDGWILCSSVKHKGNITYTFRRLIITK